MEIEGTPLQNFEFHARTAHLEPVNRQVVDRQLSDETVVLEGLRMNMRESDECTDISS